MNNNFYFVRHGKTVSNEKGIFMGTLDVCLSPNGIKQAVELYESAKDIKFDIAFSSPLSRALHTAYLVTGMAEPAGKDNTNYPFFFYPNIHIKHKIPLIIEPRLAERCLGDLQGVTKEGYTELDEFKKYKNKNITFQFDNCAKGGESFGDLEIRLTSFFEEINDNIDNKNILVFSHNGPIRVVKKYFENLSEEETLKLNNPHCEFIQYSE